MTDSIVTGKVGEAIAREAYKSNGYSVRTNNNQSATDGSRAKVDFVASKTTKNGGSSKIYVQVKSSATSPGYMSKSDQSSLKSYAKAHNGKASVSRVNTTTGAHTRSRLK